MYKEFPTSINKIFQDLRDRDVRKDELFKDIACQLKQNRSPASTLSFGQKCCHKLWQGMLKWQYKVFIVKNVCMEHKNANKVEQIYTNLQDSCKKWFKMLNVK